MKITLAFLLLCVLLAIPDSDARRMRYHHRGMRFHGSLREAARVIYRLQRTIKKVWRYAQETLHTMQSVNRRDVDSIDLNNDGRVDVEELAKVIGAREARDLMEFMSDSSDVVSSEDFTRNVRDLAEDSEGDVTNGRGELAHW